MEAHSDDSTQIQMCSSTNNSRSSSPVLSDQIGPVSDANRSFSDDAPPRYNSQRSEQHNLTGDSTNPWATNVPEPPPLAIMGPAPPPSYSTIGPVNSPHRSSQLQTVNYRGLVNQAMTCYLNSLLQTLFMTPEFRQALYQFQDETPEDDLTARRKNIPFQLQRLFVHLNFFTHARSIETVDMTKSFGWSSGDAFQQHDIQELMRVLFDALETKLKGTSQENVINDLYQGKMIDYVKCKHCGYESRREDTFQDINLAIKPFGSNKTFGSLEEALEDYIKPEVLEGSNQYHCSQCDAKRDAEKGLKITKMPYLLTIQLKRFDFDYEMFRRVKLSDRVEFHPEMDFSRFVESEDGEDRRQSVEMDVQQSPRPSELARDISLDKNSEGDSVLGSESAPASLDYELFSVMIHSGSANGGHYYAYIRSYDDKKWYNFNDENVTEISEGHLSGVFGDEKKLYSTTYASSTNAYMFVYRKVDPERNKDFQAFEQLPDHIRKLVELEKERVSGNNVSTSSNSSGQVMAALPFNSQYSSASSAPPRNGRAHVWVAKSHLDRNKTATSMEDANYDGMVKKLVTFSHDTTLAEVLERCYQKFDIDQDEIPLNQMRFCEFDQNRKLPDQALGEAQTKRVLSDEEIEERNEIIASNHETTSALEPYEQDQYYYDTKAGLGYFADGTSVSQKILEQNMVDLVPNSALAYSNKNLLLQIRSRDERFVRYRNDELCLKCYLARYDEDRFGTAKIVRISKKTTLGRVGDEIGRMYGLSRYQLKVHMASPASQSTPVQILPPKNSWDDTLAKVNVHTHVRMYCEKIETNAEKVNRLQENLSPTFDQVQRTSPVEGESIESIEPTVAQTPIIFKKPTVVQPEESKSTTISSNVEIIEVGGDADHTSQSANVQYGEQSTSVPEPPVFQLQSPRASSRVDGQTSQPSKMQDKLAQLISTQQNKQHTTVEIVPDCRPQAIPDITEFRIPIADLKSRRQRTISECQHDLPKEAEEKGTFFKVHSIQEDEFGEGDKLEKRLKLDIEIDTRMSLSQFKLRLERFTCMKTREFRVFKRYSYSDKTAEGSEISNDTYNPFGSCDGVSYIIRPGKALRQDEQRVKFFELNVNDLSKPISSTTSTEIIVSKGTEISEIKDRLAEHLGLSEEQRIRLNIRAKNAHGCAAVYADVEKSQVDFFTVNDFFYDCSDIADMPCPPKSQTNQRSLFLQRWHPSELRFDSKLIPVTLDPEPKDEPSSEADHDGIAAFTNWSHQKHDYSLKQLRTIACKTYDLANVRLAPTRGFPPTVNAALAENSLAWDPKNCDLITDSPFNLYMDSGVVIVRDATEVAKVLSTQQLEELKRKEAIRINQLRTSENQYRRKETAIKIDTS